MPENIRYGVYGQCDSWSNLSSLWSIYDHKSHCLIPEYANKFKTKKAAQEKARELNNKLSTQNETEAVKLKATSYTWQCPKCSYVQGEQFAYDAVICKRCKTLYEVTEHEHKLD